MLKNARHLVTRLGAKILSRGKSSSEAGRASTPPAWPALSAPAEPVRLSCEPTAPVKPLALAPDARVALLTGAGISVASGLRPYRGPGGLWNDEDIERWATAAAMARDPEGCWRAHREFARLVEAARPNPAHLSIAEFSRRRPPGSVTVITQNVDALHDRAGSAEVIEIHGSLSRIRCTDQRCGCRAPAPEARDADDGPPPCPRCLGPTRYDIVLFDEHLPPADERKAKEALRSADVFIAVGTSGVVFPAADYVREAARAGAVTMLVNLEPPSPQNPFFQEILLGRAETILPALLGHE